VWRGCCLVDGKSSDDHVSSIQCVKQQQAEPTHPVSLWALLTLREALGWFSCPHQLLQFNPAAAAGTSQPMKASLLENKTTKDRVGTAAAPPGLLAATLVSDSADLRANQGFVPSAILPPTETVRFGAAHSEALGKASRTNASHATGRRMFGV